MGRRFTLTEVNGNKIVIDGSRIAMLVLRDSMNYSILVTLRSGFVVIAGSD